MFKFLRLKAFYRLCVMLNLYSPHYHYHDDEWEDPTWWFHREDRRPLLAKLIRMHADGRLSFLQRIAFWFVGPEKYGIITGRETITKFKADITYPIDDVSDEGGRRIRFYDDITTAIDAGYIQVIEDALNLVVNQAAVTIQKKKEGYRYIVSIPDLPRNGRRVLQGVFNNPKTYEVIMVSKHPLFGIGFEVVSLHHCRIHNDVKVEATTNIHSETVLTYQGRDDG